MENELKNFKKRLNGALRQQVSEYRELKDSSLEEIQWQETLGAKIQTPFYMYIKDRVKSKLG